MSSTPTAMCAEGNNRMELQAVIEGRQALKERCAVTISTDSQYVQRPLTEWLALEGQRVEEKQIVKRQP